MELDLSANAISFIREWKAPVLICDTYVQKDVLYIFEIGIRDADAYQVTAVRLSDFSEDKIFCKDYPDITRNGYAVSCVTADESYLYLFTMQWHNGNEDIYILRYDPAKKAFDKLRLSEETKQILGKEAVMNMFSRNGFLILNTLEKHTYVGKITADGNLLPLQIPSELYTDMNGFYTAINPTKYQTDNVLLATTTNEETTLYYLTCAETAVFTPISIDFNKDKYNLFYLDDNENIIMRTQNFETDEDVFYLMRLKDAMPATENANASVKEE